MQLLMAFFANDFNPRSPYGERLRTYQGGKEVQDFNPRSPYGERP